MFSELFLNNDEVFIFNNVFECARMKSYDDFLINTVKCPKFDCKIGCFYLQDKKPSTEGGAGESILKIKNHVR